MAITIIQNHDEYNAPHYMEFIIDNDSERADLPGLDVCCAGSKATSIESGSVYYLTTFGLWTGPQKAFETEELRADANGIYKADPGKAFNPVYVDVSGGGDQQIHYAVSWNGDEAGRDSVAFWGFRAYKISDFAPALEDVKVDGFVLSVSVGGSTLTANVGASRESEVDTDYFIFAIKEPQNIPAGLVYDLDTERRGIYLISFDGMAQAFGARPDSITLAWQRTGQLTAADAEAKIASVSPLTLDVSWEPGNWVETIGGTLANPWGDKGLSWFIENLPVVDLTSGAWGVADITAILSFVLPDRTLKISGQVLSQGTNRVYAWPVGGNAGSSGVFMWRSNGRSFTYIEANLSIEIPETTPCTLTIIHHPLPESGT